MRNMFRSHNLRDVKVGTVDDYQGQEGKVIFVSTTVSRRYGFADASCDATAVSFIGSPQRFNVAVSRAQHMLVVVGDPWVLNVDRCASTAVFARAAHAVLTGAGAPCCDSVLATACIRDARCRHPCPSRLQVEVFHMSIRLFDHEAQLVSYTSGGFFYVFCAFCDSLSLS